MEYCMNRVGTNRTTFTNARTYPNTKWQELNISLWQNLIFFFSKNTHTHITFKAACERTMSPYRNCSVHKHFSPVSDCVTHVTRPRVALSLGNGAKLFLPYLNNFPFMLFFANSINLEKLITFCSINVWPLCLYLLAWILSAFDAVNLHLNKIRFICQERRTSTRAKWSPCVSLLMQET